MMTRSPEELRRIDAAVAEAMGLCPHVWHYIEREGVAYPSIATNLLQCNVCGAVDTFWHPVGKIDCSNYTTDTAASRAMEDWLENELSERAGYLHTLGRMINPDFRMDGRKIWLPAEGSSANDLLWGMIHATPLQRCLAFLKAMGTEVSSE